MILTAPEECAILAIFIRHFNFTKRLGLIAAFDIGAQQQVKGISTYDVWFSPILIGQWTMNEQWKMGVRVEYYQDKTGIMIPTGTPNGFQTVGLSLNIDYAPIKNVVCRLEGRWLGSQDRLFETPNQATNTNFVVAVSIAAKFSKTYARKLEQ